MSSGPERIFACDFRVNKSNGSTITDSIGNTTGTYQNGIYSDSTNGLYCNSSNFVEFNFNQYFDSNNQDQDNYYYVELYCNITATGSQKCPIAFMRNSSDGVAWTDDSYQVGMVHLRMNHQQIGSYQIGPGGNGVHASNTSQTNLLTSLNTWYHIVYTFNDNGIQAYVDGSMPAGWTYSHSSNNTAGAGTYPALMIGSYHHSNGSGQGNGFNGKIAYVNVYKGNEMTQTMVDEIYDNRATYNYEPSFSVVETIPPTAAILTKLSFTV